MPSQGLMLSVTLLFVASLDVSIALKTSKKKQETNSESPKLQGEPLVAFRKFNVQIHNELHMYLLDSHCYSKDDDLGVHVLYPNDRQSWSFKGNWLGTTMFHCKLEWENGSLEFDAFSSNVEFLTNFCGNASCCWSVRQDGIYLTNRNGQVVFKQHWEMLRT